MPNATRALTEMTWYLCPKIHRTVSHRNREKRKEEQESIEAEKEKKNSRRACYKVGVSQQRLVSPNVLCSHFTLFYCNRHGVPTI